MWSNSKVIEILEISTLFEDVQCAPVPFPEAPDQPKSSWNTQSEDQVQFTSYQRGVNS